MWNRYQAGSGAYRGGINKKGVHDEKRPINKNKTSKVYVKSRGTDRKNSDNFFILHRILFLKIGIDSCT